MISYYKTINNRIEQIEEYEEGCWINCIAPDELEVNCLIKDFGIDAEFLKSALDAEESSHIDQDGDKTLVVIDVPAIQKTEKNISYLTKPLAIILTTTNIITVSLSNNIIIRDFAEGLVKNVFTESKTHFMLNVFLRTATKYLQYLKQIDKISDHGERELRRSLKNKQLMQLLEVEKSLVYFSSSLKANEATLEKIMRGRFIKLYGEEQELLEDVLIEVRQAIEMSNIQMNILTNTMDAFASIISNNLNIVMKGLASITLIMSMPTIISGIYGMNIGLPTGSVIPFDDVWWAPIALSVALMIIAAIILKKKDML